MIKSFVTNKVIVRKFKMKDVDQAYTDILSQKNTKDFTQGILRCTDLQQTRVVVKSAMNQYNTDEPIWAVEDKKNKNLIGVIKVANYSPKNKMCNISWLISSKCYNDEFMKEALTEILKFLFTKQKVELVECSYYAKDKENNKILDEIGMLKEATLRNRRINTDTNERENFVIYSITKDEFLKNEKNKIAIEMV